MSHAIMWFEIPATDLQRARRFYEQVLGVSLQNMDSPGRPAFSFPSDWEKGEISGSIVSGEDSVPNMSGTRVYLNCGADLQPVLDRVEAAGGKVCMPKTKIPMDGEDAGFMAMIQDTEGNGVGLFSMG